MKKLFYLFAFVAMTSLLSSCAKDCKECKIVVYENGVKQSEDDQGEFCSTDLDSKEGKEEYSEDSTRVSRYECS